MTWHWLHHKHSNLSCHNINECALKLNDKIHHFPTLIIFRIKIPFQTFFFCFPSFSHQHTFSATSDDAMCYSAVYDIFMAFVGKVELFFGEGRMSLTFYLTGVAKRHHHPCYQRPSSSSHQHHWCYFIFLKSLMKNPLYEVFIVLQCRKMCEAANERESEKKVSVLLFTHFSSLVGVEG